MLNAAHAEQTHYRHRENEINDCSSFYSKKELVTRAHYALNFIYYAVLGCSHQLCFLTYYTTGSLEAGWQGQSEPPHF